MDKKVTNFGKPYTDVVKKYIKEDITNLLALGSGKLIAERRFGAKNIVAVDWFITEEARENATCIKYDIRDVYKIIPNKAFDIATLFDSLEHLTKKDGLMLLKRLEEKTKYIAIFVPIEPSKKTFPISLQEKRKREGKPLQNHLSTWRPEELVKLGYTVEVSENYHKEKGFGAMICIKKL